MTSRHSKGTRAARGFRALLRLYPAAFRDEYGREMSLVFADRYRDDPGVWARARLWAEACAGILLEAPKEHLRAVRADGRLGFRRLRQSPAFATAAVGTLALAIGVSTALFSVLDTVVLRPLPYRSPTELAMVWTGQKGQQTEGRSAYANVAQWKQRSRTVADLAVLDPGSATYLRNGVAVQVSVARVSSNFFSLLGVQPLQGRVFSADEANRREPVALVSHRFWTQEFGGSPLALGAALDVDGHRARLIGILPAGFRFARADADVWEPHSMSSEWDGGQQLRAVGPWFVIGRLRPGVPLKNAEMELASIALAIDTYLPASDRGRAISVVPLKSDVAGSKIRAALWMLTAAGCCVLLIAVANVAGLCLARGVGRIREMTIRAALGATRAVLMRQLLVEGFVLAAVSGALGLLIGVLGIRLIRVVQPAALPVLTEATLDLRVLAWTFGASCLTAVLVGLAPALAATGRQLRAAGADGGRSVAGGATARRIRQILVVTQFAIAIVLLTGAGLLARSWWHVQQIDPGFKPDRILSLQLSTPAPWSAAQRVAFYDSVLEQVRRLPGVLAAGTIGDLFVSTVAEATMTPEAESPAIPHTFRLRRDEVSPGFFEAVTAPVIEGRAFTDSDRSDGPRVAVINRLLASRLWAGEAAIGKRFTLGSDAAGGAPFTVVGVVGDMHRQGLEGELTAQMFEPLAQNPSRLETLIVHTSHDNPLTVAGPIEAIVHRIDPHVPIYGLTTLDARLGSYLAERRMQTALLIGFAGIALVMAWIGIHGLIQYSVTTRRREIAIRMAVGARSADVCWMILAEGLKLSATGLAIGLIGALLLSRAASSLLFGIRSNDPSTFAVVALLLIAVAGAASFVPARRATRTEAVIALRAE